LFFAPDIHGSEICFLKFTNIPKYYKADVIILGGDMTGKAIIPLIENASGVISVDLLGTERKATTEGEMRELEGLIRNIGYYPYRTTESEVESLSLDKNRMNELFLQLTLESIERWVTIAEERLKGKDVKCFILPGNDDNFAIDSVLERSERIINPEGMVTKIDDGHEMISTGYTNKTPWNSCRELSETELSGKIEEMASGVRDMKNCIFNLHCPPHETKIDQAPKLENLKPVYVGSQPIMTSAGSIAVRHAIEKHQPLLGLHGHIHESKGFHRLGPTLCLNPGSEYSEGILKGVLVTLGDDKLQYTFTSG
jgi:Icc-related predicted phosphoesterase